MEKLWWTMQSRWGIDNIYPYHTLKEVDNELTSSSKTNLHLIFQRIDNIENQKPCKSKTSQGPTITKKNNTIIILVMKKKQ